jgi:hypothetical protein
MIYLILAAIILITLQIMTGLFCNARLLSFQKQLHEQNLQILRNLTPIVENQKKYSATIKPGVKHMTEKHEEHALIKGEF